AEQTCGNVVPAQRSGPGTSCQWQVSTHADGGNTMTPVSIHIIEDDADLVEILTENLSNSGYSVTHDRDGSQGLEHVLAMPPDMLLLDLMLPGMQGLDVCRAMRASRCTSCVPVMIISARGDEADVVSGLELGADDYMTKPFGVRELVA